LEFGEEFQGLTLFLPTAKAKHLHLSTKDLEYITTNYKREYKIMNH